MTIEEKTLLIAVSEGLAKLLQERFQTMFGLEDPRTAMAPLRNLIEAVKEQKDVAQG